MGTVRASKRRSISRKRNRAMGWFTFTVVIMFLAALKSCVHSQDIQNVLSDMVSLLMDSQRKN